MADVVAAREAMTHDQADHWHGGWDTGRRAARSLLLALESDMDKPGQRATLAEAGRAVETMRRPACAVALPRAEALDAAIRAALAIGGEGLGPEAVAVLKAALR